MDEADHFEIKENSKLDERKLETQSQEMQFLQAIQNVVFEIKMDNIDQQTQTIMQYFDINFPISFNIVLFQCVYSSFLSQRKDVDIYFQYLKAIEIKEEQILQRKQQLFNKFQQYLQDLGSRESKYILAKMVESKLIGTDFVQNEREPFYFAHLIPKEKLKNYKESVLIYRNKDYIPKNIDKLQKNDWRLHLKYIQEGNHLELLVAIKNDNIDKLQEISAQSNFDYNQNILFSPYEIYSFISVLEIEYSTYEKHSFVESKEISLIDYAAFFGSIKCFKFLLLNGADLSNTGKYAVAGGNLEIIHLCEQNNISFIEADEAAIEFHRNDIFYYLYDNNLVKSVKRRRSKMESENARFSRSGFNFRKNFGFYSFHEQNTDKKKEQLIHLVELGIKCIQFNNYEVFSFLEEKGLKVNDLKEFFICNLFDQNTLERVKSKSFLIRDYQDINSIIGETIEELFIGGNLFLVRHIFEGEEFPKIALPFSISSRNIELVQYVLSQKGIDINLKDALLFYSMIVSII